MSEKLFRFNPFNIKEWEDKEVVEQYGILENALCFMDNPSGLANDIELYANMGYLIGEMIARYTELYSIKKVEVETTIDNLVYRERTQWTRENSEKPPAMSYFQSKAQSMHLEELKELARLEANLKRFKYAYESVDSKQNALKKKMESIKFDTFGR